MTAIHKVRSYYNAALNLDLEESPSKENHLTLITITVEDDKEKSEKIENVITILPLLVTALAIILMCILYRIFM